MKTIPLMKLDAPDSKLAGQRAFNEGPTCDAQVRVLKDSLHIIIISGHRRLAAAIDIAGYADVTDADSGNVFRIQKTDSGYVAVQRMETKG